MANIEGEAEKEKQRAIERGDFGPVMFDDRDTFGVIKAILNLKRHKT